MGMTKTQEILAANAGLDRVEAGQLISAKLDVVPGNDIVTFVAVNLLSKISGRSDEYATFGRRYTR